MYLITSLIVFILVDRSVCDTCICVCQLKILKDYHGESFIVKKVQMFDDVEKITH